MFKKIIDWLQGRHTAFAAAELAIGTALQWFHRLDMNFVALCGTVQSLVLMHSVKEDWFQNKNQTLPVQNLNSTNNVQNPDIPPNGQNG